MRSRFTEQCGLSCFVQSLPYGEILACRGEFHAVISDRHLNKEWARCIYDIAGHYDKAVTGSILSGGKRCCAEGGRPVKKDRPSSPCRAKSTRPNDMFATLHMIH